MGTEIELIPEKSLGKGQPNIAGDSQSTFLIWVTKKVDFKNEYILLSTVKKLQNCSEPPKMQFWKI